MSDIEVVDPTVDAPVEEAPAEERDELDALSPPPEELKLSTGTQVVFEDLRARQFFKLLRIITHGAAPMMGNPGLFNLDGDAAQLAARLTALVAMAVPDAEDETIDFVLSMVKPKGLIEGRALSKQDKERNEELWGQVNKDLENPELDDLFSVIEGVVKRESEDLAALGKRISSLFKAAKKTGQLPSTTT